MAINAYVEGGVLDKLLKTPVGGRLEISHEEADIILSSRLSLRGGLEVFRDLMTKGECILLGRQVVVNDALPRRADEAR